MALARRVFDVLCKAGFPVRLGHASRRKTRKSRPHHRVRLNGFEPLEQRSLLSVTLLSEGFEEAFPEYRGWSVGDANSSGTAAYWNDVNSSFGGEGTHGGSWKGYCAGTGYAGTSTSPTYQNSMSAYMSKSINLSGLSSASLSFWYKIPSIEPANWDHLRAYIDSTKVFDVSSAATSWTQTTINLNPYLGGNRTLKFEFYSDSSGTAEGAYLDDILVTGEQTSGPVNDNFANRTSISGTSATVTGTNVGATKESGEPNHAGNSGGKSVWWAWTAPSSGSTQIDTVSSNFDTTLGVYTGSSVSSLTTVASNDDSDGGVTSKVTFSAVVGTTYQIVVDGYNGASGSITTLHVNLTPAVAPQPPTNVAATDGTYTDKVRVTWTASANATAYEVWRNTSNNSGTATKISSPDVTGTSYDDTTTAAGTTYWYWVKAKNTNGTSGFSAADSGYRATSAPVNNNFVNRTSISGTSATVTGTNVNATKESGEPNHAGNVGGKSVWWTWTAPSNGSVQIDTIGSNFDTTLGVYTGSSVSSLTTVAGNDDGGGNLTSKVTINAVGGTAYQIAVDGYNGASGNITLHVSPMSLSGVLGGHPLPGLLSQITVTLSRFGDGGAPIDPTPRPTWIIIHGRDSSPTATNISDLATAVGNYSAADQVLTLDWSQGAQDNRPVYEPGIGLQGSRWIADVAAWTAARLRDLGIPASSVSLIGHSWGAHVANEIARNMASAVSGAKVKALVALDPAWLNDYYTGGTPNFSLNSSFSWAFNSSVAMGNNAYAKTATESFDVTVGNPATVAAHSNVVDLFARITEINNSQSQLVCSRFSLTRLLSGTPGPWINTSGFEASLYATQVSSGDRLRWEPIALSYGSTQEFVSPDLAGNSTTQARDIGSLSGNLSFWDWVGSLDTNDYYRFSLSTSRTLTLNLGGLTDNADLNLYNSTGVLLASSANDGTNAETISRSLSQGVYFVRVLPHSTLANYINTYYTLSLATA